MARLARGRIRYERYDECMLVLLLAVLCALAGEEDMFLVMAMFGLAKLEAYEELIAPTILEGVCPMYNFFDAIGGLDFKELFRFEKPHFRELLHELQLPEEIEIHRGGFGVSRVPIDLALAVTIWRLACPTTLIRDRLFWGIAEQMICDIFNLTIEAIFDRWGHLVNQLQHDAILSKIDMFCQAIHEKGTPLTRCWGSIDGTIRAISRPKRSQRLWYNGRKRKHALKYQAIDTPDGIIRMLWGSILGRRHDVAMVGESGLLQDLQQWFNDAAGTPYYVFGDPAYSLSPWLLAPYKGVLNAFEQTFNTAMSSVRVSVEWGFGKIVALWPYVDYAKKQQVALSACGLGKQYAVAGILTNCHSSFYRNNTSFYFGVKPPSLRSYLNGEG
ncbi:unnamed protein product [Ectocarpus sp. CCAP 1310/34]|nr:unnamed protein product [Ectocarpus sp. CCAP 1310/34]